MQSLAHMHLCSHLTSLIHMDPDIPPSSPLPVTVPAQLYSVCVRALGLVGEQCLLGEEASDFEKGVFTGQAGWWLL